MSTSQEQQTVYCQSCTMPLHSAEQFGTEAGGGLSAEYCVYCYKDGAFIQPGLSMSEMIEICVPHMVEEGMAEAEARAVLERHMPELKRWTGAGSAKELLQPVRIEELEAFTIAGIRTTTTNVEELNGTGRLGKLWEQFYTSEIAVSLGSIRMDEAVYGCYCNYEDGTAGRYDVIAGVRAATMPVESSDIAAIALPAAKYAVFTTEYGPVQQVVANAWHHIWQWFAASDVQRTFTGDFEYYDARAANPNHAQVDIYIAIR